MFNRNLLQGSCFLCTFAAMKQSYTHGHDYVEMGGVKWATMNVGAKNVTDGGLYFAWGETKGYTLEEMGKIKRFTWSEYKFEGISKYNDKDKLTTLQPEDDPVRVNWRGGWRLPTSDEFVALKNAVTSEWVDNYKNSGVNGLLVKDKSNSIKQLFFPAAGFADYGSVFGVGSCGFYWSSSLYWADPTGGWHLGFDSAFVGWEGCYGRCHGFCVRGVLE